MQFKFILLGLFAISGASASPILDQIEEIQKEIKLWGNSIPKSPESADLESLTKHISLTEQHQDTLTETLNQSPKPTKSEQEEACDGARTVFNELLYTLLDTATAGAQFKDLPGGSNVWNALLAGKKPSQQLITALKKYGEDSCREFQPGAMDKYWQKASDAWSPQSS